MNRAYYSASIHEFLQSDGALVLGELARHHHFALEDSQKNAWISQITILKSILSPISDSYLAFEYTIPRMGKRVDTIILHEGIVFVVEFKVGGDSYTSSALEQVVDYSLDLKNFHEQSHTRDIVPILLATEAAEEHLVVDRDEDGVYQPIKSTTTNLIEIIRSVTRNSRCIESFDPLAWLNSIYKPTPTIIEAAQALYKGHDVKEISRSDSGAINLSSTSNAISRIIDSSKRDGRKSICFVTGVPGAGKTLAGLNIANERHNIDEGEHAVFLSGNGPLVEVLQEALARNEVAEKKGTADRLSKKASLSKTKAFIQNIHHFRDDSIQTQKPPVEKVVVFDEAQRAWTLEKTHSFMAQKKGNPNFNQSEPEFLIGVLDRHQDWATIICLIGGGQEINTGEAGLPEWFSAIGKYYSDWDVYVSSMLTEREYTNEIDIYSLLSDVQLHIDDDLHLAVSVRSFRTELLSSFIHHILEGNTQEARSIFDLIKEDYPIVLTRDLGKARNWLRSQARGGERIGMIASSGAYRLRPYGIHMKSAVEPKTWFLNGKDDVRSSYYLEEVATEFDIQGLELDWTCVAWDANLRREEDEWSFKNFRGTAWQNVRDEERKRYLLNSYRVLLTRARQGMVIFVPEGDSLDQTRIPSYYEGVYEYLTYIGIPKL